jgi:hypothetical protein
LLGPIAAGTWQLSADGEGISSTVTMQFDIIWRHGTDTVLATTTHTFPPGSGGFSVSTFTTNLTGTAAAAQAGDQLVLRFTWMSGGTYIPNGDGTMAGGRDPNLTLP